MVDAAGAAVHADSHRALVPDARPSIAVLPLVTLADANKEDYFADGLTEDVISALGRFSELIVRSRNAVFPYKGKTPRPEEVGRELAVRYIVDGSIRRSPERIRIAIRLTDAARGALLWSENYDVAPKDIFSVQDDITRRIAGTLASRLSNLELTKAATKPPSSLETYDLVLRGRDLLNRVNRTANSQARTLLQQAIEADPNYAPAYIGLGTSRAERRLAGMDCRSRSGVAARRKSRPKSHRHRSGQRGGAFAARHASTFATPTTTARSTKCTARSNSTTATRTPTPGWRRRCSGPAMSMDRCKAFETAGQARSQLHGQ